MAKRKQEYGNESISMLEGADRVRKRPGVIFGSDGLEGCEHAVFEILSNAIDEAREGFGKEIVVTHFRDGRIQVEDFGRGCPVDWNEKVGKYNWELVFCELYAGGKYDNNGGDNYEYSLGLNGLGACATQYTARFMDVIVRRDGKRYDLHFEKGQLIGEMKVSPADRKKTGTTITWLPDLEVFTQTDIPDEYFKDVLHRQAVVNAGITFRFKTQAERGFDETTYVYENGIADYVAELAGEHAHTPIQFWTGERVGRDRPDKPDYKVKLSCAFCFCPAAHTIEHYHNSSWLEHGGAPEKAMRSAFLSAMDGWLKQNGKYNKTEAEDHLARRPGDCLIFVSNDFSTQTSYENQTKKAVNNRFIQESMTDFLREHLRNFPHREPPGRRGSRPADPRQQAQPRGRGKGPPVHQEQEPGRQRRHRQPGAEVRGLPHQRCLPPGAVHRGGRLRPRLREAGPGRRVPGHHARPRQDPELPEGRLRQDLQERDHHRPAQGHGLRRRGPRQAQQGPLPV